MSETIFEKILSGDIPSNKVYEDDKVYAFHDINPQAPVHVLVITKQKIKSLAEADQLSADYMGHYTQVIAKIARQLELEPEGYRVVFNIGQNGGQEVPYIHAHILGGRQMKWPPG